MAHAVARPATGEQARFEFALPQAGSVRLVIYDLSGRRAAVLMDGPVTAGAHGATWAGKDAGNGVYIADFQAGFFRGRGKVVVVK